jgi:hypothetical protein
MNPEVQSSMINCVSIRGCGKYQRYTSLIS